MEETRSIVKQSAVLTVAAVVVVAGIFGAYYWYSHRTADTPAPAPAPPPAASAPETPANTGPEHPLADEGADHTTPLDRSDPVFIEALARLNGWSPAVLKLLLPGDLIRHIVATVDALPREKLPIAALPTKPVPGPFRVTAQGDATTISPVNARRYDALVGAANGLDMAGLARVYRHFYPLFQQAYHDLGYPKGNFNDRLVEVIDDLLEAPDPKPPVAVVSPGVMYHYVDPDLEALSSGQKILVRMGEANEKIVKAKLGEFRAAVVAP
jgi:hypothetical protein